MTLYHWQDHLGTHLLLYAEGRGAYTCTFVQPAEAEEALKELRQAQGLEIVDTAPPAILFTRVRLLSTREFLAVTRQLAAAGQPSAPGALAAGAAPRAGAAADRPWAIQKQRQHLQIPPELSPGDIAARIERYHQEMDRCLVTGDYDGALRAARRIAHLRQEALGSLKLGRAGGVYRN